MNDSDSDISVPEMMDDGLHYKNFVFYSRFMVQRIFVPFIMTFGVIGNAITIIIMTRRRMRSSTNIYLAALAISDMTYLIFTFILSLSHYPHMKDSDKYAYWSLRPYFLMMTDTCSNTSVWLTVTFTAERYIAVCHPMKGKVFCTESRAKKAILVVFLFCFAFAIPTPFEWAVQEQVNSETNHTVLHLGYSELGNNETFTDVYYWLTVVVFIFIPFVLLAIFNSFLIRAVHLSKKQRSSMTRGENDNSQENKITIMLIAVVILFFVCQIPTACHMLYMTFVKNFTNNDIDLLTGLGNIFNLLMSLNSAGNFVLYCLLSQKYRRIFVQIFCQCLREKQNNTNSTYYQSTVVCNESEDSLARNSSDPMSKTCTNQEIGSLNADEKNHPILNGNNQSTFIEGSNISNNVVTDGDDMQKHDNDQELVELSEK